MALGYARVRVRCQALAKKGPSWLFCIHFHTIYRDWIFPAMSSALPPSRQSIETDLRTSCSRKLPRQSSRHRRSTTWRTSTTHPALNVQSTSQTFPRIDQHQERSFGFPKCPDIQAPNIICGLYAVTSVCRNEVGKPMRSLATYSSDHKDLPLGEVSLYGLFLIHTFYNV
jgi:hypothetical protein